MKYHTPYTISHQCGNFFTAEMFTAWMLYLIMSCNLK